MRIDIPAELINFPPVRVKMFIKIEVFDKIKSRCYSETT